MAVVEHEHIIHDAPAPRSNNSGLIVGLILAIVFLFLLFYYGIPAIRSAGSSATPQVNVPGKVDVNVHSGK